MRTHTKILVCAAAASMLLLACSDNDTSTNDKCKAKAAKVIAQLANDSDCEVYDEFGQCKFRNLTPIDRETYLRIEPMVEKWMEEQFESGSNDRAQFSVTDLLSPISEEYEIRVSPPIGEIVGKGYNSWVALMTAEEIAELTEKYKGLIIDFFSGEVGTNGSGYVNIDSSAPCD